MFQTIVCLTVLCATAWSMTTTAPASGAQILYDMQHHKAMIVKADGCYEYAMNHQDIEDTKDATTKATLEARMLTELAAATDITESGHHHIDHMTQEIQTACASLPVYQWTRPIA